MLNKKEALYTIKIACQLTGFHPQTLRKYERCKLVVPARKEGNRFYSEEEIDLLKHIKSLVTTYKFNLSGIRLALAIEKKGLNLAKLLCK